MRITVLNLIDRVMAERDRLYAARFEAAETAVKVGLAAQKELVQAAFESSEKAIVKAEAAQASYNETHNDLSRKMDAQYERMMPRAEAVAIIDALREKVAALEKSAASGVGKSVGLNAGWGYLVGAVGLALALYAALRP